MEKMVRTGGGGGLVERVPESVLLEILTRLDLESLFSAAPVCRTFRCLVSQAFCSIRTLDLSGFPLDAEILNRMLSDIKVLQSLTLDCYQLDDSSIKIFAKEHLQELVLLKCHFSSWIFIAIGELCPNLRVVMIEMVHLIEIVHWLEIASSQDFSQMLKKCLYLEYLCVKLQAQELSPDELGSIEFVLPRSIKVLLLRPISEKQAKKLLCKTRANKELTTSSTNCGIPYLADITFNLQSVTLVLDRITDELLITIISNLHLLVELCLEDRPIEEPSSHQDLTNTGLQSLTSHGHLTRLSLTRSKPGTFTRVNDMGMFLLAEGCTSLESVRLGGFSRVTDAGYVSILYSCKNLKRFEIINAVFLSDLAFHNLVDSPCSPIEVRLISCSLLTSETADSLSKCKSLEVLDLSGCKSIGDFGLSSVSKLCRLTVLDLGGADITDSGLSDLGSGSSPIASLCLRGCKRVTDRGVASLLFGDGFISKTLLTLDLGYLPGLSDRAIFTIAEACRKITELCIRCCYSVTDASIVALGSMEGPEGRRRMLRKLDLFRCNGLSLNSLELLRRPYFRGLRWLGVGGTVLSNKGTNGIAVISRDRQCVSICLDGCEMGCKDGWQFHRHV